MVTVWWFDAGLIYYSSLNPSETITSEKYAQQIDEMHWKPQCLKLTLVNRKGPSSPWQCSSACHTATASKVEQIGPHLSCHINLTSCQWTTTSSSILTTFVRQNGSAMSRRQKCFPRVHWIPKHGFLCYRNNTFFIGKTVLIVMALILINKHVSLVVMI